MVAGRSPVSQVAVSDGRITAKKRPAPNPWGGFEAGLAVRKSSGFPEDRRVRRLTGWPRLMGPPWSNVRLWDYAGTGFSTFK